MIPPSYCDYNMYLKNNRASSTTPPCSEGIQWYVTQKHIHASHDANRRNGCVSSS